MKRAVLVLSSLSFVSLAAACSGASDSELFAAPTSSQFGTDPTPGNNTDNPGASSSSSSSSTGGGSTSSSGGSTSSTSSGGSTSSSSSGGSTSSSSSSSSGSSTSSSGGTWKSPGIFCGTDENNADVYCQSGTSVCCVGKFGNFGMQCQPAGNSCSQGAITLKCNDETDCPNGQVCCAQFDQQNGYKSASCQTSCNGSSQVTVAVRMCDPEAPTDQCLAIGKTCQPSGSLSGYSICK